MRTMIDEPTMTDKIAVDNARSDQAQPAAQSLGECSWK